MHICLLVAVTTASATSTHSRWELYARMDVAARGVHGTGINSSVDLCQLIIYVIRVRSTACKPASVDVSTDRRPVTLTQHGWLVHGVCV